MTFCGGSSVLLTFSRNTGQRETVKLLFEYRDKLKLEDGKYKLIALYKEVWDEKADKGHTK
jgi:hypothetical protein